MLALVTLAFSAPVDGDLSLQTVQIVDGTLLFELDEPSWRETRQHEAPLTLVVYKNDEIAWSQEVWRRGGEVPLPFELARGDRMAVQLVGFDGEWHVRSTNGLAGPVPVGSWTEALLAEDVYACSGLLRGSSACIAASSDALTPDFLELVRECDRLLYADALVSECVVALASSKVDVVPLVDACDLAFERDHDELMCVALVPDVRDVDRCANEGDSDAVLGCLAL